MRKNIVLVTNGNLQSLLALRGWLSNHSNFIARVYVTYKLPSSRGNIRGVLSLLFRSGFQYTAQKIWLNKIAPLILRSRGVPCSVADFLIKIGYDGRVEYVDSVNNSSIIEFVRGAEIDFVVSFSATHRFSENFLQAPRKGSINVHYGALPAFAGLSPYFWHLQNDESEFGVTLHKIEPRLDAGPILSQVRKPILTRDSLELMLQMTQEVSPLLNDFFSDPEILSRGQEQDLSRRSYFGHPTMNDVRSFRSRGKRIMSKASRRKMLSAASKTI